MGEYSKALEYYEKALKIREISLPPTHPDLATSYNNIGQVYNSMVIHSSSLADNYDEEKQPVVYIVGFNQLVLPLAPNSEEVVTCNTVKHFVNDISYMDLENPFYIVSSEPAPDDLLSNRNLVRYYYVPVSMVHDQKDVIIHERITTLSSIKEFPTTLFTDLSQYYLNQAYPNLSKQHNQNEKPKSFLAKSKKCLEMLKYVIRSLSPTPMNHSASNEPPN
ncbi:unnamed protein product [Rotaria magnacalcarata]|uniref:Kinesin light chain n=1 Tax=Rotaria magnacalcarata TaxID=392030 RepID=A0A815WXT8_9BILA|nr:unnamed protein product [Rotaria magnacalcarata]